MADAWASASRDPSPWVPLSYAGFGRLHETWLELGEALARDDVVVPSRTTLMNAQDWAERCGMAIARAEQEARLPWNLLAAVEAVRSGIAPDDLYALSRVPVNPAYPDASWPAMPVTGLLASARNTYRRCTVRDMLGWRLQQVSPAAWEEWSRHGLGDDGWLHAAAGFTPADAAWGRNHGHISHYEARTLAALRGSSLPVD